MTAPPTSYQLAVVQVGRHAHQAHNGVFSRGLIERRGIFHSGWGISRTGLVAECESLRPIAWFVRDLHESRDGECLALLMRMMDWLATLESSGFGTWLRESGSIWGYPTVLTLHTLGLVVLSVVLLFRIKRDVFGHDRRDLLYRRTGPVRQ